MLLRVVILPYIFIPKSGNNPWYFNTIINLLQDILKNCILLVDKDNCIITALKEAVEKWPIKFRDKAQRLLVQLNKENRIVAVDSSPILSFQCMSDPCKHCIGITKTYLPRILLAIDDCYKCAKEQLSSVNTVPILHVANYAASNFADACEQNSCSITIDNGEWTQEKFEEKVLIPIFKDAKHIKIYDRMIGRSIRYTTGETTSINGIPEHYCETLKWLLDIYLQHSSSKATRIFEVYSGFDIRSLDENKISEAQRVLRQFEADMQTEFSFPSFKLTIKEEEGRKQEMPHGRYLITDQIGVLIERGFDLLWTDQQMRDNALNPSKHDRPIRDVTISRISEPNKIETAVRKLPDL